MILEQIYTGCLAQGAYYIESNGEAAVIDPLREIHSYIEKAERNGAKIKWVFETHFHADFVSGHIDLAKHTGAKIVYGPTAQPAFEATIAADGQEFKIGDVSLKVLHTPGHTMESSCFLLKDESGKDVALFTGDTLFIGDVGRPDLAQKVKAELTEDILADHLYNSLRNKILPLNDDIIVYPAHGAGSACGKNMSKETSDTLGHQKEVNYALRPGLSKDQFKKELLTGLTPPPGYFPLNVLMNIKGYDSINDVLERGTRPLTADEFETLANQTDALILDTRNAQEFAKAFIPNSVNIGIDGSFAPWVGTLVPDIKQPILIIAEDNKAEEVITRLARVGYDHAIGYLQGGFDSWVRAGKETDSIPTISAEELYNLYEKDPGMNIIDVRKKSEYDSEHIETAINAPLDYMNESMNLVNKEKPAYIHCGSGYHSMIFASILKARGYDQVIDVKGGIRSIKKDDKFKLTEFVCPTTML